MDSILEALKDLSKLPDLVAEQADLETNLYNYVNEKVSELGLEAVITSLLEGEGSTFSYSDPTLFRKAQDEAVNYIGDVTEQALKLAVVSYVMQGKIEGVAEKNEVLGSLFGLEKEDADYNTESTLSTKARADLSDSTFCGPNRSFPVPDKAHAVAALRLLGRYKGDDKEKIRACIENKARKFGVGAKEGIIELYPLITEQDDLIYTPLILTTVEQVTELQSNLTVLDNYGLSETQKAEVVRFLDEAALILADSAPLLLSDVSVESTTLSPKFFLESFIKSETDSRKYLVPLVGLIRQNQLTREDVNSASTKYDVFGTRILENWLKNTPDKEVAAVEQVETVKVIPFQVTEVENEEEDFDLMKEYFRR